MKIAVEGCAHGELENIYNSIDEIEKQEGFKTDLLICCGDFQSSRNEEDLMCMAIPQKYHNICSFYKYYNGEKKAPILTIFIGGNHEASNYLQELPYGGWVAPNIYYLGYAGVINIAGIRIGGLSGIYKGHDFYKGRFEKSPYNDSSKRSVYHVRNIDIFRLKQLSEPFDVFLSHDWPSGIYNYGNVEQLLKRKPFFKEDIESTRLGSKPCEELLHHLKPSYWFSAHLHCKFAALVKHDNGKSTRFLALDKCLPKRKFLQIVDIPHNEEEKMEISYDLEWLTILYLTNHLVSVKSGNSFMPGPGGNERYIFTPTDEEKSLILKKFGNSMLIPKNFRKTAPAHQSGNTVRRKNVKQPMAQLNPQTFEFCDVLEVDDPVSLIAEQSGSNLSCSFMEEEDEDISANLTFQISTDSDIVSPIKNVSHNLLKLPDPKYFTSSNFEEEAEESVTSNSQNDSCVKDNQMTSDIGESDIPTEQLSTSITDSPNTDVLAKEMSNVIDTQIDENLGEVDNEAAESSEDSKNDTCESIGESMKVIEITNSETPQKKFKRRNAEIYNKIED